MNSPKVSNRFEFVTVAGARARQLLNGSIPRVPVDNHKKTTVAKQEVLTRAVTKIEEGDSQPTAGDQRSAISD